MERTKHLISFLPALLSLVDQEVEKFISKCVSTNLVVVFTWLYWLLLAVYFQRFVHCHCYRSNCNYYFCLSCLITWFGHEVNGHSTIVRLTDLFLSTHPMMSLYLAAAVSVCISVVPILSLYSYICPYVPTYVPMSLHMSLYPYMSPCPYICIHVPKYVPIPGSVFLTVCHCIGCVSGGDPVSTQAMLAVLEVIVILYFLPNIIDYHNASK